MNLEKTNKDRLWKPLNVTVQDGIFYEQHKTLQWKTIKRGTQSELHTKKLVKGQNGL